MVYLVNYGLSHNLGLRTRLVDAVSTPDLLQIVESGGIEPGIIVSHGESTLKMNIGHETDTCQDFPFDQIHNAYDVFELASKHGALKVVVTMPEPYSNGS
jgi:alcohol dehydrogenase